MYVRPSQMTTSVVDAGSRARRAWPRARAGQRGGRLDRRAPVVIRAPGRWYSQYEIFNGGTGARPDHDGVSAMDELVVNVMNTPVEAVETEFPVRVERYELVPDSAGAGTFRGGLGTRGQWRILAEESIVNLRTDRFKSSVARAFRRQAGASLQGRRSIRDAPRAAAHLEGRRAAAASKAMWLSWQLAGGGGWGDPWKRDPEARRATMSDAATCRVEAARDGLRRRAPARSDTSIDTRRPHSCAQARVA